MIWKPSISINGREPRDPVEDYAIQVLRGKIIAGEMVRNACGRFLHDLDHQEEKGIRWNWDDAQRVIDFFQEVLRLAEGEWAGAPFELDLWQMFVVGNIFGWYGDDGFRRFRTAYLEIGKGNGKTPLAAGIGIYGIVADNEQGAEVYAAAVSRDQAGILFRDACLMVEASPILSRHIRKTAHNLACYDKASFMRPVSAEGRSLDGKRVHMGLLDEIHEHRTPIVVDKMRAGTKNRRQGLIMMITNSGYDRASVCWYYHEYARKVCEGSYDDDSFFGYVCGLDVNDDWQDESCWIKANPGLDEILPRKYLREQVREAIGMPAKQNIVKRLNFCIWTEAADRWLDKVGAQLWHSLGERAIDGEALCGRECYGGLDLSAVQDLTALVLMFPAEEGDWVECLPFFWLPEEGLYEKEIRDGVPYTTWRDMGYLEATPGKSIDQRFIARRISEIMEDYDVRGIAFDRYGIQYLRPYLEDEGLRIEECSHTDDQIQLQVGNRLLMVRWGQGYLGMNEPIKEFERLILDGRLRHGGNPVLNMCAANAVTTSDPAGNRKWVKGDDKARIDGIVSASMAAGLMARRVVKAEPEYQMLVMGAA